jgi:hypothetical protein
MSASSGPVVRNSVAQVNDEVAVGEDLSFQRRWWRFERFAWIFFTLIIVLDLAGAFGRGPLAHARAQSSDQELTVEYERIERTGTPSMMNITLGTNTLRADHIELFVSETVFSGLGAQRVVPQPAESRVGRGGLSYTFLARDAPARVSLELTPPHAGWFSFRLRAVNGAEVTGKIWVVP